jgi:hypothetical protein
MGAVALAKVQFVMTLGAPPPGSGRCPAAVRVEVPDPPSAAWRAAKAVQDRYGADRITVDVESLPRAVVSPAPIVQ